MVRHHVADTEAEEPVYLHLKEASTGVDSADVIRARFQEQHRAEILVVEVDGGTGAVPVTCLNQTELIHRTGVTANIIWRKDEAELGEKGNSYRIGLEESLGGGNYTCHLEDGSLLNYTTVLLFRAGQTKRILKSTGLDEYLQCAAENYNGGFHCSWTKDTFRDGHVVHVNAQRHNNDDDYQCSTDSSGHYRSCASERSQITCSVNATGSQISCMEEQHCPYSEETRPIEVTIYFRSDYYLVEIYSKEFFLSEIVKPGKLGISKINETTISLSYPRSWNTPHSYFPLAFQIVQFRKTRTRCPKPSDNSMAKENADALLSDSCLIEVEPKTGSLCVRARDSVSNSDWGEFSLYK
ncbi:interleukin 12Ba precursor [Neosynchiropus ocellatus]